LNDGKYPVEMSAVLLETILEMPERHSMEDFFEAIYRSTILAGVGARSPELPWVGGRFTLIGGP
jgi:hypothetical protein